MPLQNSIEVMEAVIDDNDNKTAPASDPVLREVRDRLSDISSTTGNRDGLNGFEETDDGSGSVLPSNPVPDGFAALIVAQDGNAGPVAVGPAGGPYVIPLAARERVAVEVTNTDAIGIQADQNGDGVGVLVES